MRTTVLAFGLALLQGTVTAAWQAPGREHRIGLLVADKQCTSLRNEPAVLTGARLAERTGMDVGGIDTRSITVLDNAGAPTPCQVDERDGTGLLVEAPNHRLDPDDEIVFEVKVPRGGTSQYWLYFGGACDAAAKGKSGKVKTADNRNSASKDYGQLLVTTPCFKAIVKGPSVGDAATPSHASYGVGSINDLEFQGVKVASTLYGWCSSLPTGATMGGKENSAAVTLPTVVVDGPVRTTVQIRRDVSKAESDGYGYAGKVVRYWTFYGDVPLIELEDIYDEGELDTARNCVGLYKNQFVVGGQYPRPSAVLYTPAGGKVAETRFDGFCTKEKKVEFHRKQEGGEAWIAWVDEAEAYDKGFAVFYERSGRGAVLGFFEGTGKPEPLKNGGPWNYVDYHWRQQESRRLRYTLAYRGLLANDVGRHAQAYYRCWDKHLDDMVEFGPVEHKGGE